MLNEIKKALYKEKPVAQFQYIRKGITYYQTHLTELGVVNFEVPVSDMGDADFTQEMEGNLLNRWIVC